MKILVVFLLCLSIPLSLKAERFASPIHSIDYGNGEEPHLIRFENGRVSFVDRHDHELLSALEESSDMKENVGVEVNNMNDILGVQSVQTFDESPEEVDLQAEKIHHTYKPSVVTNYNAALTVHNKMRKDYTTNGQCFSRAHIWAYEEFRRSKLKSMKVFMFFTERYIRRYKFHWWFHVTPMVYVGNLSSPRTLDRRYTTGPRQTKVWSDVFIKSKRRCKEVKRFDDFWLNQESEDCYHIYTSMYYYIPRDIEKRDITGVEKNQFIEKEIKKSYKDGFNR